MNDENTALLGLDNGDADVPFIMGQSPFIHGSAATSKLMAHVMVAMMPALIMSGLIFGGRPLVLIGVCVLTAMLWERLANLIFRRHRSTDDLTAAVTGMLFGLTLPPTFPYLKAAVGTFISIMVFKQLFGGAGKNIFNPAAAGRIVIYFMFMKDFVYMMPMTDPADQLFDATPLQTGAENYHNLFLGNVTGGIGEISVLAAVLGMFYLLAMGVAGLYSSVSFVGAVYVFSLLTGQDALYQILAGGVVLCAVFMANDYVTTPLMPLGRVIFGLLAGVIAAALRYWLHFEGACYAAILIVNLLTPVIDRVTERKPWVK